MFKVLLVTGGSGSNGKNTEIFVEGAETWTKLDEGADLQRRGLSVVSVDNTVLAIGCLCHEICCHFCALLTGGIDGKFFSDSILKFDTNIQTWNQVGNLKIGRYEHAVTIVNSSDIVCGTTQWSTTTTTGP